MKNPLRWGFFRALRRLQSVKQLDGATYEATARSGHAVNLVAIAVTVVVFR